MSCTHLRNGFFNWLGILEICSLLYILEKSLIAVEKMGGDKEFKQLPKRRWGQGDGLGASGR